jgi:uncharacterized protein YndB with AHSA1/START domain
MWKWLGGCLVIVVLLIAAATWWGYQAMQNQLGPSGAATVTIAGSPARVFATLADGDSASTWMAAGNSVTTTRRGRLVPGDILRVVMRATVGMPPQHLNWQVSEVVPDTLLALELRPDTGTVVLATLRDSLVSAGDSTSIISTVLSPMMDSISSRTSGKGKTGGILAGATANLMLSAFRMQAKLDLLQLKSHIEGGPPVMPRK